MTKQKAEIRLVEVWKDFDPVFHSRLKVKGSDRVIDRVLRVALKEDKLNLTPEMIADGIKYMMEHVSKKTGKTYAHLGYYAQGVKLGRRTLYRIGREVSGQKDFPIFINVKTGRVFFQDIHIKNYRKRLPQILAMRLGALGIKTTTKLVKSKAVRS